MMIMMMIILSLLGQLGCGNNNNNKHACLLDAGKIK
jgi:hypothetical protein